MACACRRLGTTHAAVIVIRWRAVRAPSPRAPPVDSRRRLGSSSPVGRGRGGRRTRRVPVSRTRSRLAAAGYLRRANRAVLRHPRSSARADAVVAGRPPVAAVARRPRGRARSCAGPQRRHGAPRSSVCSDPLGPVVAQHALGVPVGPRRSARSDAAPRGSPHLLDCGPASDHAERPRRPRRTGAGAASTPRPSRAPRRVCRRTGGGRRLDMTGTPAERAASWPSAPAIERVSHCPSARVARSLVWSHDPRPRRRRTPLGGRRRPDARAGVEDRGTIPCPLERASASDDARRGTISRARVRDSPHDRMPRAGRLRRARRARACSAASTCSTRSAG